MSVKQFGLILCFLYLSAVTVASQQSQIPALERQSPQGNSSQTDSARLSTALVTDSIRSQLIGQWVALNRSEGGIGSIWEFKPDGTFTMSPGVVVDMRYRLEGDTLTLPPATTLPDAKPQIIKIRFEGDHLYQKYSDAPVEMPFIRIQAGRPGDAPIVGRWKPDLTFPNQGKSAVPAARFSDMATYTFTRDGILRLRLAFRPISGGYDVNDHTFSLHLAGSTGQSKPFTGHFELRHGELYLTQPDGHTQDVYIRDDFESRNRIGPQEQALIKKRIAARQEERSTVEQEMIPATPARFPGFLCREKYDPQQPGADKALPAPRLLVPKDGSILDHYPRYTTLAWNPVPGADGYCVQSDYESGERWLSASYDSVPVLHHTYIPTYSFNFVGAQPGRWRVWAVDAQGNPGLKSEWREFRYSR
jgi:hypothetical protein